MAQYKDLNDFLAKHQTQQGAVATHTRIPDKELNIHGGSFVISKDELPVFNKLYCEAVFVHKKKEYLTERQLDVDGPICVDFDFRYSLDVEKRQHTGENIQDMVLLYLEELKSLYTFSEVPFDIFVFEKPNVNKVVEKQLTKDGIHMMICIKSDHILQIILRERILMKLPDIWDLPLTNSWDSVLDDGISKGVTNWQLYGSRKPGNEAYEMTHSYQIQLDKSDNEFMMNERPLTTFNAKQDFFKVSVKNDSNPGFEKNPGILVDYKKRTELKTHKMKRPISRTKVNLLLLTDDNSDGGNDESISLNDINSHERLDRAMNLILSQLKPEEYYVKETHQYTQILPEKYYEPGSHLLNRQVAFALKRTDERLFLSWIMLRSKASDFDFNEIPNMYNQWKKYFNSYTSGPGVTRNSILFWAKQDAFEEYQNVKMTTINHFMDIAIMSGAEWDIAQVMKQMFKDKYVCVSFTQKQGSWYVFKNHRWEPDKGISLRMAISSEMYMLFSKRYEDMSCEFHKYESTDTRAEMIRKKLNCISVIMAKLKKTADKNNIVRESMELFFDSDFVKNMDTNKQLLCFNNGVVDFKQKVFRDGYPQDYITKSTNIDYIEAGDIKDKNSIQDVVGFMEKLFPIPDLNRYMWDHLASTLIGTNRNQTFNIYHGSGSNGKSMLISFMALVLGDYKGTVPITLVTEKRNSIGGTSSEVMQLKGIRYAVMQEPSKGVKLNEGIMKELTGGDPLQARALYSESEVFDPQFKLCVCTNNLFDIDSNDDGTWRRVRKCDFLSKFVDPGQENNHETPYVFLKDKSLEEKLPVLAPIFASMLVKRAFETDGIVLDCEIVLAASNKYRKGQDHIAAFVSEKIEVTGVNGDRIKKTMLMDEFKEWFEQEQGRNRKMPKGQELYDYMDKKFGSHTQTGWKGVKLIYPVDTEANEDDS